MRSDFLKRVIDIAGSAFGLILSVPVMLLVAVLIGITMGSPLLFRQRRAGLRGEPFIIYKFRSMRNIPHEDDDPLLDDRRLTWLGRILRNTSLDELPELLNVLKGEMSLVGPRPLLIDYLERYTPDQARRHEVKPGISGWAQVKGRNALSWEEKFELDVWYVDHWSLWLDLKILALTPLAVLKREGISAAGSATMPPFQGVQEEQHD